MKWLLICLLLAGCDGAELHKFLPNWVAPGRNHPQGLFR